MDFTGKTAIVTGAAVGIGRATAIMLAEKGADVVAVDIDEKKLDSVKAELQRINKKCMTLICDISDSEQVFAVTDKIFQTFGHIDILVNNAAVWRNFNLFINVPLDDWKKLLDINVMGTVYFTKAVLPFMLNVGCGRIINVASIAGVYGNATMSPYSATKGAVIALTKAIAREVADKGITVNAVSPGTVSPAEQSDMDYVEPNQRSYMGRTGSDNENASLICFLASDKAAYISGENILIDGCRKIL